MRPIDADGLEIDMVEEVFDGDGSYKIFGYSKRQIDAAPTIAPPPNDPLTVEELRGMDGEPVWCRSEHRPEGAGWYLVRAAASLPGDFIAVGLTRSIPCAGIETGYWEAYRHRPEEGA